MSDFQDILDEADDVETEAPVASATAEAPTPETPEVEAAGTREEPALDAAQDTGTAPASTPITREDGATWSENAKRWYKDGKIVAGEAPAKVEQAPEAVTPAPVVADAPKAPEVPAPVAAEPFAFRANGQRHVIEGLTVAPEKADLVRALLVDGMNHRQNFPRMQAEWKEKLAQAEQAGGAKGDKYNKASVLLWSRIESMLQDNPTELEMLRREVALTLREADMQIPKAAQPEQEVDNEPAARATLAGYVKELFEDNADASKYFTPEDRKAFEQDVQDLVEAFFVERDGDILLNEVKVETQFKRQLGLLQRAHQARETAARDAEKKKAALAFNAGQKPGVVTPPTPPRPKPALAAAPSGAKAKNWDQRVSDVWKERDDDE